MSYNEGLNVLRLFPEFITFCSYAIVASLKISEFPENEFSGGVWVLLCAL